MDRLQQANPRLHRVLVRMCRLGSASGNVDIDPAPLSEFNLGELQEFLNAEPQPPSQRVVAAPSLEELAVERKERQRLEDLERGLARLQQYVQEHGLAEDPSNAEAIDGFLKTRLRGYWSAQGVDAAIVNLGPRGSDVLKWKPKVIAPPPQPEEPQEVLEPWQLPIDADEAMMRRADVKALQDLIKRRRAATNQQYVRRGGFFSSHF